MIGFEPITFYTQSRYTTIMLHTDKKTIIKLFKYETYYYNYEPEMDLNHYIQGMSLISYQLLHLAQILNK